MTQRKSVVRVRKRTRAASPSTEAPAQSSRNRVANDRRQEPRRLQTEDVSIVDAPAEQGSDYEVGYGKPPKHTRFKPGQSGNPQGRPKARKNFKTDLIEELGEQISVREDGRRHTVSKQRAMLKSLTAKALQGDARSASLLANMVFRFLQQEEEPEDRHDLSSEDLAILEAFQNRVQRTPTERQKRANEGVKS